MNDFKGQEEKLIKKLEDLREDYILYKESYKEEKCCFSICNCSWWKYYILFSLFSLAHFLLMAVIEAVLFSIMREVYREFHFICHKKYDDDDKKDFIYYITKSSKNDTSQINFNYLSSFITHFFICKTNFYIPYILSNIFTISIIVWCCFLTFWILKKFNFYNYLVVILSFSLILFHCCSKKKDIKIESNNLVKNINKEQNKNRELYNPDEVINDNKNLEYKKNPDYSAYYSLGYIYL